MMIACLIDVQGTGRKLPFLKRATLAIMYDTNKECMPHLAGKASECTEKSDFSLRLACVFSAKEDVTYYLRFWKWLHLHQSHCTILAQFIAMSNVNKTPRGIYIPNDMRSVAKELFMILIAK